MSIVSVLVANDELSEATISERGHQQVAPLLQSCSCHVVVFMKTTWRSY